MVISGVQPSHRELAFGIKLGPSSKFKEIKAMIRFFPSSELIIEVDFQRWLGFYFFQLFPCAVQIYSNLSHSNILLLSRMDNILMQHPSLSIQ